MSRVEPDPRDPGIDDGLAARVHDPLWLLARQWQLGEFQGLDAGSVAIVDVETDMHQLDSWRPGTDGDWQPWDVTAQPLERLVESERPVPAVDPRLRLLGGVLLSRLLAAAGVTDPTVAAAFRSACAFPPADPGAPPPPATGLSAVLQARVPDGRALAPLLASLANPATAGPAADGLGLPAGSRPAVTAVAAQWLSWWSPRAGGTVPAAGAGPVGAPDPAVDPAAWDAHRMEYSFGVRASTLPDVELRGQGFVGGPLDWPSVDVVAPPPPAAGTAPPPATPTHRTIRGIPGPATFGGMPRPRFWEMEDAQFDPAGIDAAPQDTGRLLLVTFATVYGNDWYVVPVRLPVGTLFGVTSFTVTDVFGTPETLPAVAAESADWNLYTLTDTRQASQASPWFLLAAALPAALQGPDLETVALARDEAADLAWAIERFVPDAAGGVCDRHELWAARPRPAPASSALPSYRVDTDVPEFWFPLAPEQLPDAESVRLRLVPLERATSGEAPEALPFGQLLAAARVAAAGAGGGVADPDPIWLYEEEVPRSGVTLTRQHHRARWRDGSVHTWTARRRSSGTGESASGLAFDTLVPPGT